MNPYLDANIPRITATLATQSEVPRVDFGLQDLGQQAGHLYTIEAKLPNCVMFNGNPWGVLNGEYRTTEDDWQQLNQGGSCSVTFDYTGWIVGGTISGTLTVIQYSPQPCPNN